VKGETCHAFWAPDDMKFPGLFAQSLRCLPDGWWSITRLTFAPPPRFLMPLMSLHARKWKSSCAKRDETQTHLRTAGAGPRAFFRNPGRIFSSTGARPIGTRHESERRGRFIDMPRVARCHLGAGAQMSPNIPTFPESIPGPDGGRSLRPLGGGLGGE